MVTVIFFIEVIFASVVLQCLVRFTSECHVLVHCSFADKDHWVTIAYFLDCVPFPSKEISELQVIHGRPAWLQAIRIGCDD